LNFKYLTTLREYLTHFQEQRQALASKTLDDRKEEISDLRQKYFDELLTNADTYEKMKGTPLCFNTSQFVLVHKTSMKYLSFDDSDADNLSFCLVDYPTENSFFKLAPCLKMQTQKSNVIYSNDQVYLINLRLRINQNPRLMVHIDPKRREQDGFEYPSLGISANLEKDTMLKVNLHLDIEMVDDTESLKTGDIIWLNYSERPYFVEASMPREAIEDTLSEVADSLQNKLQGGNEDGAMEMVASSYLVNWLSNGQTAYELQSIVSKNQRR
jgi:hypothetical protein